jgi:hypothetical protein
MLTPGAWAGVLRFGGEPHHRRRQWGLRLGRRVGPPRRALRVVDVPEAVTIRPSGAATGAHASGALGASCFGAARPRDSRGRATNARDTADFDVDGVAVRLLQPPVPTGRDAGGASAPATRARAGRAREVLVGPHRQFGGAVLRAHPRPLDRDASATERDRPRTTRWAGGAVTLGR